MGLRGGLFGTLFYLLFGVYSFSLYYASITLDYILWSIIN